MLADECRSGFVSAEQIISFSSPAAVYADFNEDGRVDVAFSDPGGTLYVFLNRGSRTFQQLNKKVYTELQTTTLVRAADVNGDGHVDLVWGPGNIWTQLGDGNGNFAAPVRSAVGNSAAPYVDVDGDGRKDFVFYTGSQTISVQFATAGGKFAAPADLVTLPHFLTDTEPLVVGDFDGDGHPDLYASGDWSPTATFYQWFWFNDGSGHFGAPIEVATPGASFSPVLDAYDFDGDGAADVLVRDDIKETMVMLRAKARKVTSQTVDASWNNRFLGVSSLAGAGDFDGDGKADALFQNGMVVWGGGSASKLDATLFDVLTYAPGVGNSGAQVADIDGDGIPDIAGSGGRRGLFVIYGRSHSRQLNGGVVTMGAALGDSAIADFNGDGIPDVVPPPSGTLNAFISDGHGYVLKHAQDAGGPAFFGEQKTAAADLDGDGNVDLIAGNPSQVVFGRGDGTFTSTPIRFDGTSLLGTGRIDSGGAAFLASGNDVNMLTFSRDRVPTMTKIFTPPANGLPFVLDVDGDSITDLFVSTSSVTEIVKKGNSGWSVAAQLSVRQPVRALTAADFDGDGRVDLVTCDEFFTCELSLATASGYAAPRIVLTRQSLPASPAAILAADVDRDGRQDLIIPADGNIIVYRNTGGGNFAPYSAADASTGYRAFTADVDRDGVLDLVLTDVLEVVRGGCAPSRIHVAVTPQQVTEGAPVTVVVNVHPESISGAVITLREGSRMIGSREASSTSFDLGALSAGLHSYVASYEDSLLGHYEQAFSISVAAVPPKRHSAHH